jgi:Uma2 family endonuclease
MSLNDKNQVATADDRNDVDLDEIDFYWEIHPTEKAQMSESFPHHYLMFYLEDVIGYLLRYEERVVAGNVAIYTSRDTGKGNHPLEPDLMVVKGMSLTPYELNRLRSWKMWQRRRPPPNVVFEFASKETWDDDLYTKPQDYVRTQVREYFAYDPNSPQYYDIAPIRLKGWRYQNGQPVEIVPNDQGWLWSGELDSYLVPDGRMLRLYDRAGNLRLTGEEAERAAKEAERKAKEKAHAKLRELGIDPDTL